MWVLHSAVIVLILTVWSLPWGWALWLGLALYPVVQLNWCVFGNRCVLTVLEERLRHPEGMSEAGEPPLHFVSGLLSRILGRPVSHFWGDVVSYVVVWGGFALCLTRLLDGDAG